MTSGPLKTRRVLGAVLGERRFSLYFERGLVFESLPKNRIVWAILGDCCSKSKP
jgi:hypothetical protein